MPHGAVCLSMMSWRISLILSRAASSSSSECWPSTERSVVCAICDVATRKFSICVTAACGIDDAEVGHRGHPHRHVVLGDDLLRRDRERHRAQVDLDHAVEERDEQDEPRPLGSREQAAEPEDHPALVLAQDANRRADDQDGDDDDGDGDDHECVHAGILCGRRRGSGATSRTRPFLTRRRARARPASAPPSGRRACQRSPWTSTWPLGCRPVRTVASSPTSVTPGAARGQAARLPEPRDRRTSRSGRASPRWPARARSWSCRRASRRHGRADAAEQDRARPHRRERPCAGTCASSPSNAIPNASSATPAHENGTIESPSSESSSETVPSSPGQHDARMRQLEGDAQDAAEEEQRDQVGIEQDVEHAQLERQLAALDRGAGQLEAPAACARSRARRSLPAAPAGRRRRGR